MAWWRRIRTVSGKVARTATIINKLPYRVKSTKAKQPETEIEVEDDLVIDDNLDLIDRGNRYKYII